MDWIELLIPIIIVLLYLFSRSKGGEKEDAESKWGESGESNDEARRIQEEIRRKIVARQQGKSVAEETEVPVAPDDYEEVPEKSFYTEREAAFERYGDEEHFRRYGGDSMSRPAASGGRAAESGARQPPARDYEGELKKQLERLKKSREARREAEGSLESEEIGSGASSLYTAGRVQRRYGTYPVDSIRDELYDPANLKKAFILKEVLGRPVASRPISDSYAELSHDLAPPPADPASGRKT